MRYRTWLISISFSFLGWLPLTAQDFHGNFANVHDRIWVGPELWANPMEDWRIQNGRLECISSGPNRNVQALTRELAKKPGTLTMSVRLGLLEKGKGSAGFRIGIQDEIDDYRARLIYGSGLNSGITSEGELFVGDSRQAVKLPDLSTGAVILHLGVEPKQGDTSRVTLTVKDSAGKDLGSVGKDVANQQLWGNLALVNNHQGGVGKKDKKDKKAPEAKEGARFWFDDWRIAGDKVANHSERAFGPVLWSTYTLSRGVLKMLAHMPPIGDKESQTVSLEIQESGAWKKIADAKIEPNSRTVQFRVPNWVDTRDVPYRLAYVQMTKDGKKMESTYAGTVRKDPAHWKDNLVVAGFTGNADYGFPNLEINRNLRHQNPDLLFFSGDNIYEYVGGYPLIRTPPDRAILNYLRKWYLVGLAFGDLCRDRPSIFIPDDHDVYQGNIWGNGGNPITMAEHERGGYAMDPAFVNVVHRTQTGNLPDPFDPMPLQQNISVYYCPLVYGRVGFAVISDRMFKSGPKGNVSAWEGRPDHLKDPKFDVKLLDKPGLHLLGERQEKFLKEWAADWKGVDMKCVLSQTNFCNVANYHGAQQEYLVADLDSGSWPQSARNRAIDLMRRGFALHYNGDQHLATIVQYGIDQPGDGNFSFCVPSIANFYPRRWVPDKEGLPVKNRPDPKLPNTGDYLDGLKNHIRVLAVGNPEATFRNSSRLEGLHDKSSGYGIVRFNRKDQTIAMECYKLLVDVAKPQAVNQFPGWPRTIRMTDNYGRKPTGFLPNVRVQGMTDPVIQVVDEATKEVVYTLRVKGDQFRPMVFSSGPFTIRVGEPGTDQVNEFRAVEPTGSTQATLLGIFPKKK